MRVVIQHPVLRRVLEALGTLLGVAVLVFIMMRALPGDQITASLGTEAAALTPAQREALEAYYGLDQPLVVQFFTWLGNVLTGNLGVSTRTGQSVLEMTAASLPVTIELAVISTILGIAIGVPLAIWSASRPNSVRDASGQLVGLAGLSIPAFLLASVLLATSARFLGYNPNAEQFATLFSDPWLNLQQMLMPALVLGFGLAAPIMRTARSAILEVQTQDFVRTARGKGVKPRVVQFRHVLRNATVPILTMTGIQFGYLLGGAVVVEEVFSVPGIGRQVLTGMHQQEFALVQSTVLVIALSFVLVNLLTDVLYRVVDPRVRQT
ncbi:peptide/nickel transport system permease protein [Georgenia satyanarayanai]|uniref:Peptide/nickel transport system permease protein n=1 Tax=Georgenia satyanarayanai TaxID=860221 RepID=A0A2Y8ZWD7_9MICO|nr:ABC transporter permease [Georgenia satyanarayanai]PYG01837.1 peptide/nickel transport system permease protein [Georgenia satyanarayanai]SSA36640.1 peptide/nickel transport system permease protein [Georgenia satyanarayanai]